MIELSIDSQGIRTRKLVRGQSDQMSEDGIREKSFKRSSGDRLNAINLPVSITDTALIHFSCPSIPPPLTP